jgi:hypothetical protein|nr:MAG TPA: hypothetical protein [Caudoviricetes sp.]
MPHKSAHSRAGGGDSPPTFYSILSKAQNCEKANFSPLHHRLELLDISPKLGMSVFWDSPILDRPFRGAKLRCQLAAENSALLCLNGFSQKSEKPPGLPKLNFQC